MAKHSRRLIIHPPSMVSSPALRQKHHGHNLHRWLGELECSALPMAGHGWTSRPVRRSKHAKESYYRLPRQTHDPAVCTRRNEPTHNSASITQRAVQPSSPTNFFVSIRIPARALRRCLRQPTPHDVCSDMPSCPQIDTIDKTEDQRLNLQADEHNVSERRVQPRLNVQQHSPYPFS